MREKGKVTTLTQEVIRRFRNTSREASQEERDRVLTKFAQQMFISGYREENRKMILLAGIKWYQKQLDLDERKIRKLNRHQEEGKTARVVAKLNGRSGSGERRKWRELKLVLVLILLPGMCIGNRSRDLANLLHTGSSLQVQEALVTFREGHSGGGEWFKTLHPARVSTCRGLTGALKIRPGGARSEGCGGDNAYPSYSIGGAQEKGE